MCSSETCSPSSPARSYTRFDADLLRRYDRPGPRYTSYPTAPQFGTGFGETELREHIRRSNADHVPRPLSLYLHIPYCFSPCFYCGCTRIISRDRAKGRGYVERLMLEIERVAPLLARSREVVQLHLGGGTPNFLDVSELGDLVHGLRQRFQFSASVDRDFSIEIDPRAVKPGDMDLLALLGFNRASLGVQDFDPEVQRAVNRIQTVEETVAVLTACRSNGFRSVNFDLIYGLPKQTLAGFDRTLDAVLEARPDRIAVYGYAHLPELFKAQRRIERADLPDARMRIELLGLAIERFGAAGYRYIGMDHFALPSDDLARAHEAGSLRRNFMGYTTHAESDLIGFGVSAISHIGESFSQNPRELAAWIRALEEGRLPVWRGKQLDADDILRADVIQQIMCRGTVDIDAVEERFGIRFGEYFASALGQLDALKADDLVAFEPNRIRATSKGRLLLRVVAAAFDRYLEQPAPAVVPHAYSRAI